MSSPTPQRRTSGSGSSLTSSRGPAARPAGRATVPGRANPPGRGAAPVVPGRAAAPASPGRTSAGGGLIGADRPGGGGSGRPPGAKGGGVYGGGGGRPPIAPRRKTKPRWGRIALVVVGIVLLASAGAAAAATLYGKKLESNVARTDPFAALTGGRPVATTTGAINMLLVGSDSRDPGSTVESANAWRADTIIVMHIPKDHQEAYMISLPRDLYVPIPPNAGAPCGGERHKINAAFAFGGLPLAVKTVECLTDIRMSHVVAIDFGGFKDVTDALGGVDMNIEQSITSIHPPHRKFTKGKMHLDGAQALDYVRQRYQFSDGDFSRVRHQQQFLKALMNKAASSGTLSNPAKLNRFLKAATKALTVDKDLKVIDMAIQFKDLRGSNLHFLTSPHLGSQTINGESVVVSDKEKALSLYEAISRDRVAQWVKENPSATAKKTG